MLKSPVASCAWTTGQAGTAARRPSVMTRLVATVAVLAVPLVSWGLYIKLGSPDLPSQPLAERLAKNPADSSVDELVARAEAHLAANPSDGRGWDVLAPIYLRLQRYSDAVAAYRNAIRLDGDSAARQAGLGEAIANAAGGIVSAEAQDAFEAALKLDPANAKASFYLAMGLAQEGRAAEATAAWQNMLGTLPPELPWRRAVEQALAETAKTAVASGTPANGPDAQAVEAAQSMSPQDRQTMIETMVAGLDEKLQTKSARHGRMDAAHSFLCRAWQGRPGARCAEPRHSRLWRRQRGSEEVHRLCRFARPDGDGVDDDAQAETIVGDRRGAGFPRRRHGSDLLRARPEGLLFLHARQISPRQPSSPDSASGSAASSKRARSSAGRARPSPFR